MSIVISGSLAYDTILRTKDLASLQGMLGPDDSLVLSLFDIHTGFGGCAGNIAYTLSLLGLPAAPLSVVGRDHQAYADHLIASSITTELICVKPGERTPQCFIVHDRRGAQLIFWFAGVLGSTLEPPLPKKISLGVVAASTPQTMIRHAREFNEMRVPILLDLGQVTAFLGARDLMSMLADSVWLSVNHNEAYHLQAMLGMTLREIASKVRALIVTQGVRGSRIYSGSDLIDIPAVCAPNVADSIGCGDAYRAGLIYGLVHSYSWYVTGQLASLLAALVAQAVGAQSHHFTLSDVRTRYFTQYGSRLPE